MSVNSHCGEGIIYEHEREAGGLPTHDTRRSSVWNSVAKRTLVQNTVEFGPSDAYSAMNSENHCLIEDATIGTQKSLGKPLRRAIECEE